MEQTTKILYIAFHSILFSLGLLFLITITKSYHSLVKATKATISEEVLYQQYHVMDKRTISQAEIIATLFQPLEYDIKIDDLLIRKSNHTIDHISSYNIKETIYNQTYQYDQAGNIIMIIYQSCEVVEQFNFR